MDIKLVKNTNTEASLVINLNEKDYQDKVKQKIKDYSKKATVKGFRPGKVPPTLIQKMYGKGIKIEEINQILTESVNEYIKSNDLKILGEPLPDLDHVDQIEWENQKEFEFTYQLGLVDSFQLDLDKQVKYYEIEIDDKLLDETVEKLKQQYGAYENPEVSAEDDMIYVQISQEDGLEKKALINLKEVKESEKKQFTGLKKEDSLEVDLNNLYSEKEKLASLLGIAEEETDKLEGQFKLTVLNINRVKPAELNQDLFDKVLGKDKVSTESEFREKLRETMAENYQGDSNYLFMRDMRNILLESTPIELPENFLKKLLKIRGKDQVADENLEHEYHHYAEELKWNLIVNKISEEHKIEVGQEEVTAKGRELILNQLRNAGYTEEALGSNFDAIVQNYLYKDDGKNYMQTYESARMDKVQQFLREKINPATEKVTMEDFRKLFTN